MATTAVVIADDEPINEAINAQEGSDTLLPVNPSEFLKLDLRELDLENLDNWLPKMQAVQLLGATERTLERKVRDGVIEKRLRSLPGSRRKSMPVFNPVHVQQYMRNALQPRPAFQLLPPQPETEPLMPQQKAQLASAMPEVVERVMELIDATARKLAPAPEPPLFVDLDTACSVAGIIENLRPAFKRLLKRAIKNGELPAHRVGGTYFIHRDSLFNFRPEPKKQNDSDNDDDDDNGRPYAVGR